MKRLRLILFLFVQAFAFSVTAQTVFYTNNFEVATGWNFSSTTLANKWTIGTCENNGGLAGAYITSGGTTNDCSPTGINHYGYVNAPSGSQNVVLFRTIDATCYSSIQVLYDLKLNGESGNDFFELVYSTDGGTSWTAASGPTTNIPAYSQQTVNLPGALNFSSFQLGFRFTYNSTVVNGNPPAIDNLIVRGASNDVTPPSVVCPSTVNVYANSVCLAVVPDVSITVNDDCTPNAFITYSQSPAIGSFIGDTTVATITAFDATGNNNQCQTTFIFIDTLAPTIACPLSQTIYTNASCNATMIDYTNMVFSQDNCNTSVVSQVYPTIGSNLSLGSYQVEMSAVDTFGNAGSCYFTLQVIDTISPTVVCPTSASVFANSNCFGFVGTFAAQVTASDNCYSSGQLVYSQTPPAITSFTDSTLVTITMTDPSGNNGTCSFYVHTIDTISPVLTCLSDTNVVINSGCNITIPDLEGTAVVVESCSSFSNLTFAQTPTAGTVVNGATTVTLYYTDQAGNTVTCNTQVTPIDLVAPTILCPGNSTLNNGTNCTAALTNFVPLTTTTDNCIISSVTQSPPAGTLVNAGTTVVTLTATDAYGNSTSCTTEFTVIETQAPTIICPSNQTVCNPVVNYSLPSGNDNCAFQIVQTDVTGLQSGDLFPIGNTTLTYMAIDSSGNSATCSFTIQVLDYPDTTTITFDTLALCSQFTTTVTALPIQSGTGTWTSSTPGAQFATPNAPSSAVSGLAYGINTIYWTVTSASCGTKRDSAVVLVSQLPSTANVVDSVLICDASGVLQASIPASGTGTWNTTTTIQFSDSHSPITSISGIQEGFSTVYWSVNTPGCIANSDSLVVYRPFTASISNIDTTICKEDLPFVLSATTNGPNQSSVWSILQGQLTLSATFASSTSITNGTPGVCIIGFQQSHPVCGTTSDTITIVLQNCGDAFGNIATMFTPNGDGENDYFELGNLNEMHPDSKVIIINRWGSVVYESTGYAIPWDGRYNGEDVPIGTYFYEVSSPSNAFETFAGSISIIR